MSLIMNSNKGKTPAKTKPVWREWTETVVISVALAAFIIVFIAQSFVVKGSSMEPTFHNGERMLVNKFIYRFTEPKRGDVIVFKPQGAPHDRYIKRVIGVPGDVITIENKEVRVNGKVIDETGYTAIKVQEDYGKYVVPEGHVFVMGDNRYYRASSDSRFAFPVGYVDYKSIKGKAFVVYWPLFNIRAIFNPKYENLNVE